MNYDEYVEMTKKFDFNKGWLFQKEWNYDFSYFIYIYCCVGIPRKFDFSFQDKLLVSVLFILIAVVLYFISFKNELYQKHASWTCQLPVTFQQILKWKVRKLIKSIWIPLVIIVIGLIFTQLDRLRIVIMICTTWVFYPITFYSELISYPKWLKTSALIGMFAMYIFYRNIFNFWYDHALIVLFISIGASIIITKKLRYEVERFNG